MASSCWIRENACSRSREPLCDERKPRTALRPSSITWRISCSTRPSGRLRRRILGQAVHGHVQLHGSAQKALQQRVVQFLRDAGALRQPLLETNVELAGELAQPEAIESQNGERAGRDHAEPKPPGLPERGSHLESERGFVPVPDAIRVAGDHAEAIRAGAEVGVDGFAARTGSLQPRSKPSSRNGNERAREPKDSGRHSRR